MKSCKHFRCYLAGLVMAIIAITNVSANAAIYYVSSSTGSDTASGTSPTRNGAAGPWKTLKRASTKYAPGDKILLKCGDTWNEDLRPKGSGTSTNPILISSYGKGSKPVIDRLDDKKDLFGIYLSDQGGYKIVGIEFNRCMTGIYGEYSDGCPTKKYIWIEDCYFYDSLKYQHYEDYPKRKIGLGICFFTYERDKRIVLEDITIKNCLFRRLASGVWTNNPDNFNKNASYVYNFKNMVMDHCRFEEGYQWQQGIRGVDTGAMRNCVTHDIGRNFRSFNGVAGSMFFRCKNWTFDDSEWGFVSIGLGSGDGEAFDFEGNCDNMIMRNCLFHDTDGPGFLLCCYASDGHAHTKIVMENCVINGKSKRPIGLPKCAIVNTTDWNESTWKGCRFYLSPGEALMRVMDPEKDKRSKFYNCVIKKLSDSCSTTNLAIKARVTVSSQIGTRSATYVNDGKSTSVWTATEATGQWLEIDFRRDTKINEFRIKEGPASSITQYEIEYWDEKSARWVSCFNGMNIGNSFVAPIVQRSTKKVRLLIKQTKSGNPAIAEFEAYHDTSSTFAHDLLGRTKPIKRTVIATKPIASTTTTTTREPTRPAAPSHSGKPAGTNSPSGVQIAKGAYPETVVVGDAGNQADSTGYGAVGYVYGIGKYEVTNEQFVRFLNAVARTDARSLYDGRMATEGDDRNYGGIRRSGRSGAYDYQVKEGKGKNPVNYVTWETAVRYTNWLTNGQGSGDTESGAYKIEFGSVTVPDHATLARAKKVAWVISSENEWYKAAYFDPKKNGGAGYWVYPTKDGSAPRANLGTNYPVKVGTFTKSASAYGTFDQGGNVWEFNDSKRGNKVGLRGGSFWVNDNATYLRSSARYDVLSAKWPNYGFRVVVLGGGKSK
jgi:formylglycine-generating enzyme